MLPTVVIVTVGFGADGEPRVPSPGECRLVGSLGPQRMHCPCPHRSGELDENVPGELRRSRWQRESAKTSARRAAFAGKGVRALAGTTFFFDARRAPTPRAGRRASSLAGSAARDRSRRSPSLPRARPAAPPLTPLMEITPAAEAASSDKPFRFTLADTTRAAKKLSWSTGKAAWTFGTSFLLLVVPLIIQLHREEQMMAMEQEQLGVLNSGGAAEPATSK